MSAKRRLTRSVDHFAYAPDGWATRLPDDATNQEFWTTLAERDSSHCEAVKARARSAEPQWRLSGDVRDALLAYVLSLTARRTQPVTLLDYGGNLGDNYWISKALCPEIDVSYHCKELPGVVEAGRKLTPAAAWHTDDGCFEQRYDLVMFASCLQCLPDWEAVLRQASASTRHFLLLIDVPTIRHAPSYVVTQRYRGMTNLQYQLNRGEIVNIVERAGLRLIREVNMGAHPNVDHAPEQPMRAALVFQRAATR